ncbi:hypothetical protein WA026_016642 [Henosepilachna vigintioctopunctata]|uniref:Uncharacterized protein n=1 Tax=Henosepilachna vigintioctopunctata TaxID=420089 RepID=A0AAW1VGL4_9CUCU
MKILMRRQQKRVEFIQSLEKMHRMQEIMDYSLEDLWQDYNELLIQFEQDSEFVDTPAESDNLSTHTEQTSLYQDVGNKVDQENNETVEQSDKEDEEQPCNNHSTDPYFIDVKL